MKLIDAHHHIWIPEQRDPDIGYVWLRDIGALKPFGDPTPIQRDYEWDEFSSESTQHELIGSVFLQTDGALEKPKLETEWVHSVFNRSALTHGIVCFVDLDKDNAPLMLEKHRRSNYLRGVRQIVSKLDDKPSISFAGKHYLRSSQWQSHLGLLEQLKLSFDLQLYPEQMLEATEVFSRYPNLSVIIDHAGSPWNSTPDGFLRWQQGVAAMAELPQCIMKLSGFGMFNPHWNASTVEPMLRHCLQQFGSERMMFGSNYPVDKLMASYDDIVGYVCNGLHQASDKLGLSGDDVIQDVFVNTAQRVYRL